MNDLILRDYTVAEFRGNFPQIATDQRVDMESLVTGDDTPFFVTLPLARIGETSANGLLYDEELVKDIEAQAVGKGGIMGHLKDEERDTAFPIEDADWVGVMRQGETLWGKAYIPPGAAREYIRRLKARGGRLATSIYGPYQEQLPDESTGSYRIRGLRLEQLDLAPADRAALQLGGDFAITAQMTESENNELEVDDMPTKAEIVAELTANDLPETLREQIVNDWQKANKQNGRVTELEQQVSDRDTLIAELQKTVKANQVKEFDASLDKTVAELIDWKVDDKSQEKVAAFRRTVRGRIVAELGDERDEAKVKETIDAVWVEMKPLAEMLRDALSGGPAYVPGRNGGGNVRELDESPAAVAAARGKMGL